MFCSIILRLPNKQPEIIYTHDNFNEALNEFENLALDCVANLGGEESRKITKLGDIQGRGYYCCSSYNKFTIYQKEKNGWVWSGQLKILKEFELICVKTPYRKNYKDLQNELQKRIDTGINNIADIIDNYWMNKETDN